MLAGAYELSRGGVREASCNLSFFPGSVWGSSRPGRFWATGDGSTAASEKVPNFRQKKGLCLRYRKGYQKCYSASRCPWVAFLISTIVLLFQPDQHLDVKKTTKN